MRIKGYDTEKEPERKLLLALIAGMTRSGRWEMADQFMTGLEPGASEIWDELRRRFQNDVAQLEAQLGTLLPLLSGSERALISVAANLPQRTTGQQPHHMAVHLVQRLGQTLWSNWVAEAVRDTRTDRERPGIQARCAGQDASNSFRKVTEDYQSVVQKAYATDWLTPLDVDRGALERALEASRERCDGANAFSADELLKKVRFKEGTYERQSSRSDDEYREKIKEAWKYVADQVEAEVLQMVGLPEIMIYGPLEPPRRDEDYPTNGASYCPRTRTINILSTRLNEEQIAHEFGHHIEEQGPVEIWCGLTSYLQLYSRGPLLPPPQERRNGEQRYDCLASGGFPLSKLRSTYAASYYIDAGTELLAMALQNRVLTAVSPDNVRWPADKHVSGQATAPDAGSAPDWDPRLLVLLLHAFRPGLMRVLGISYPTLLSQSRSHA